jgi:hypothetical protein
MAEVQHHMTASQLLENSNSLMISSTTFLGTGDAPSLIKLGSTVHQERVLTDHHPPVH